MLVVGAGITGITAAYLLKRAGYNVALVDKDRCLSGDTSYTTAHLTCVTDTLLSELVKNFGKDHAQAVWDAQLAAIDMIDRIVWREQIKCQFDWVPAYLFNPSAETGRPDQEDRSIDLQKEADLATELGFDAEFIACAPFFNRPAVRFDNQAKFHPRKYLDRAAAAPLRRKRLPDFRADRRSTTIEGTPITATTSERRRGYIASTCSSRRTCRCRESRDCCPRRFFNRNSRRTASYVVGGWVPRGTVHEALFWDTGDPYDYLRVDRRHDHDFVIFGGEDHKTGQVEETTQCFSRLEQRLKLLAAGDCRDASVVGAGHRNQ